MNRLNYPCGLRVIFENPPFYRRARVFVNSREETTGIGVAKLSDAVGRPLENHVASGFSGDTAAFWKRTAEVGTPNTRRLVWCLATSQRTLYGKQWISCHSSNDDNLRRYFPKLTSIKEFIVARNISDVSVWIYIFRKAGIW